MAEGAWTGHELTVKCCAVEWVVVDREVESADGKACAYGNCGWQRINIA